MRMVRTKRLILRQWRQEDRPIFADMCADHLVMEYFPSILSREQSDALLDRFYRDIELNGWGFWAAERIDTNDFVGFIGMNYSADGLPFAPCVDIGWRLARPHWGLGFATEGGRAVLNYAFTQTDLTQLVSMTPVKNLRSRRVMEKLGMFKSDANFLHPKVPEDSPLQEHVLYKIDKQQWSAQ